MISKIIIITSFFFILSCGGIDLVLNENDTPNYLKNKTSIVFGVGKREKFSQEIFSFFGNKKNGEYILITNFSEKKINRLVKKNQVAEKIDYKLTAEYIVFYRNQDCKIFNKQIVTKFSFVPKSFGYNFGTDRSLDKLYTRSVRKNIKSFIDLIPEEKPAYNEN